MNFTEYIDYFKTAAINNKAIAHNATTNPAFYRLDIEEVLNGLRGKLNSVSPALVLENPEITGQDLLSDNKRKLWRGAFLIIKHVQKGDFDAETTVLNDTLDIVEQVLSKMVNDSIKHRNNNSYTPAIGTFDANRVRIQKIGPVFDNFYGWRCEFDLNQSFNRSLRLDASKWNNETEYSI